MLSLSEERKSIRVVGDQQCTPSYVPHVARGITTQHKQRIYHVVNDGSTSWHDFTCELFLAVGQKVSVTKITTDDYPTVVATVQRS